MLRVAEVARRRVLMAVMITLVIVALQTSASAQSSGPTSPPQSTGTSTSCLVQESSGCIDSTFANNILLEQSDVPSGYQYKPQNQNNNTPVPAVCSANPALQGLTGAPTNAYQDSGSSDYSLSVDTIASAAETVHDPADATNAVNTLGSTDFWNCSIQNSPNPDQNGQSTSNENVVADPSPGLGDTSSEVTLTFDVTNADGSYGAVSLNEVAVAVGHSFVDMVFGTTASFTTDIPTNNVPTEVQQQLVTLTVGRMRNQEAQIEALLSGSTSGTTPCVVPQSPIPTTTPLLNESDVSTAVGASFSYVGWTDEPGSGPNNVLVRQCQWTGPMLPAWAPGATGQETEQVTLSLSAPFGPGGAQAQFSSDMQAWQPGAATVPGLGDNAFTLPYQDEANALEVLTSDRIITVGIQAPSAQLIQSDHSEVVLAGLVLNHLLGPQKKPPPPGAVNGTTGGPESKDCGVSTALGVDTKLTQTLNKQINKWDFKHLPIAAATLTLPRTGLFLNLGPSFEPGDFTFCSKGISAASTHTPWTDPDSTLGVQGGADASLGPFVYSSELAQWTQLDKSTPQDQSFTTQFKFDPSVAFPKGFNVDISKQGLNASFVLSEVVLASGTVGLDLVNDSGKVLTVELGPQLVLDLYVSKKDLVDEIAKTLQEDPQSEQAAADDVAKQVATDEAAAIETEGEGFYGMSSSQIEMSLEQHLDPQLAQDFQSWLKGLTPESPDSVELQNEGVTVDDLPAADAAVFEGDAAGGADGLLGKGVCDVLFGGPEDPLGDVICVAA